MLKGGEGGSNLPREKGSGGGGGWNGSKLDGPRPGGSDGGLGSIYGSETGLTGEGKFLCCYCCCCFLEMWFFLSAYLTFFESQNFYRAGLVNF